MTTVINTPQPKEGSDSVLGMVLGVILVLVLITLFFVYVLPTMNTDTAPKNDSLNVNVTLPASKITPPATENTPPSPNP